MTTPELTQLADCVCGHTYADHEPTTGSPMCGMWCPCRAYSSTTPTPPADTRQQAAERQVVWHEREQREVSDLLVAGAQTVHEGWDAPPGFRYAMARAVLAAYGCAPSALASSSPALPEPPAPKVEQDGLMGWHLSWLQHPVIVGRPRDASGWVNVGLDCADSDMTPAEARLLASTLLAAADVAEEADRA